MKKIYIDTAEWYPIYTFKLKGEFKYEELNTVEISDKELDQLIKAFEAFNKAQDFLFLRSKW